MCEARARHDWQQTAGLMALIANVYRGKGKRAFKPEDIHPLAGPKGGRRRRRATVSQKDGFAFLKRIVQSGQLKGMPKPKAKRVQDLPQT
jgi:hypothetical protein